MSPSLELGLKICICLALMESPSLPLLPATWWMIIRPKKTDKKRDQLGRQEVIAFTKRTATVLQVRCDICHCKKRFDTNALHLVCTLLVFQKSIECTSMIILCHLTGMQNGKLTIDPATLLSVRTFGTTSCEYDESSFNVSFCCMVERTSPPTPSPSSSQLTKPPKSWKIWNTSMTTPMSYFPPPLQLPTDGPFILFKVIQLSWLPNARCKITQKEAFLLAKNLLGRNALAKS